MRLISALSLALALVAAAPLTAGAQGDPAPAPRDTFPAPQIRGPLLEPIAGVRMGFPQKLSAFVGLGLAQHRTRDGWAGWSITVEPGLGGGLVGIGQTVTMPFSSTGRMQVAVLRTWGDPWLVGPDQTFIGLDNVLSVLHVGISLSGYVRVPEPGVDPGVLFSAGLVLTL
jgi:hypothetical protein